MLKLPPPLNYEMWLDFWYKDYWLENLEASIFAWLYVPSVVVTLLPFWCYFGHWRCSSCPSVRRSVLSVLYWTGLDWTLLASYHHAVHFQYHAAHFLHHSAHFWHHFAHFWQHAAHFWHNVAQFWQFLTVFYAVFYCFLLVLTVSDCFLLFLTVSYCFLLWICEYVGHPF